MTHNTTISKEKSYYLTELNKMKADDANTRKTLTPVTYLLMLFGLSYNVKVKRENLNLYWFSGVLRIFVMGTVLGALSMFAIYYKITRGDYITISVRLTDFVQSIYDYCQYVVDLIYVRKYGREVYRDYFKQYVAIDEILGTGSCKAIKKRLMIITTLSITIWLTISMLDFGAWVINYGWATPAAFAMAYVYFLIKILNTLDFTSQTMHVEIRLRIVGDLVQSYYSTINTQPGVACDPLKNNKWFYKTKTNLRVKERETLKKCASNNCHEIRLLSNCYLMLTEQCSFINQMFGMRILLNSLSLLIDMVRFSNLAVRIITGSQVVSSVLNYRHWLPIISTISRILACGYILSTLVNHCEKVYRQSDRIVTILDHLLINKNPDPSSREAMVELRRLVQQRPINFHLSNFVRLDNSMLLSTASVVVTYTIILLQTHT